MDYTLKNKRVRIIKMVDKFAPSPGTEGTIQATDDMGQHLVKWDNGSSLSLIPEIDEFKIL